MRLADKFRSFEHSFDRRIAREASDMLLDLASALHGDERPALQAFDPLGTRIMLNPLTKRRAAVKRIALLLLAGASLLSTNMAAEETNGASVEGDENL